MAIAAGAAGVDRLFGRFGGPRRSLRRRQRLHVIRDRRAVVGWKLRSILDHASHGAAGGVVIGRCPGFEEIGDILLAPIAYPFLGDVRHPALALRIGSPGEALRGDDAAKEIARAVTLRAMAEAVHEIGAAIPLCRARSVS